MSPPDRDDEDRAAILARRAAFVAAALAALGASACGEVKQPIPTLEARDAEGPPRVVLDASPPTDSGIDASSTDHRGPPGTDDDLDAESTDAGRPTFRRRTRGLLDASAEPMVCLSPAMFYAPKPGK